MNSEQMKIKRPELLAPAGSRASLEAAIEGGADAVYLGASQFNARMRADNFDDSSIRESLALCRAYGVKTYITLNTRLFDDELSDALSLAARLWEWGADAFIVADMGIASLIKKHIPDLELHASTQLSGHNLLDAETLCRSGFTRMVCHREIDSESLKELCKHSPIEIEMFIHGAYCVSFSGQCLMSAVLGGRSGNRGECAQPCRQPYFAGGKKGYPISLKDMCLAAHMKEICDSGVASLKIEGRQKPPEYVYGVTKIYRRLIDEKRDANDDEIEALRRIFSRDGFSDGYYTSKGAGMRGVRTYEDFLAMDKSKFEGLRRKVSVDMTLYAADGERGKLVVSSPFGTAVSETDSVLRRGSVAPLTYDGALKNASRLGSTPFVLNKLILNVDDSAPLTLSALNKLRRDAVEKLMATNRVHTDVPAVVFDKKKSAGKLMYTAEFQCVEQITPLAKEFFGRIYLPYGIDGFDEYDVTLPPYMPDSVTSAVCESMKGRRVLCHSAGQLAFAKKLAAEAAGSFRMNVLNSASAEIFGEGAPFVTVSPEVRLSKIRDMSSPCPVSAVVYGRLPLMLTMRCALSDGGEKCPRHSLGLALPGSSVPHGSMCRGEIADRHRVSFPVFGMPDCTNIIYNSVPIYMADKYDELCDAGISVFHFIFTDENAEQCDEVINAYKKRLPAREGAAIRRLK